LGPAKKQLFQQGSLISPSWHYQQMTTLRLRTSEPDYEAKKKISDENEKIQTRDPLL